MVITYSVSELMAIGETVLDMHPQNWLYQQQQLTVLMEQQKLQSHCHFNHGPGAQSNIGYNPIMNEEQKFINNIVLMNQLESLNQQQHLNRHHHRQQQQQQYQYSDSASKSMTADTFLRDFEHVHQKLGLTKSTPQSYASMMERSAGEFIMSQLQGNFQHDSNSNQLTDSVANFFRNFRPSADLDSSSRIRRLSDVEAELIGQKSATSLT